MQEKIIAKRLDAICPICNGSTDVGGECNYCSFDWETDNRTEKQKYIDEWTRLEKAGATKEEKADFLRNNVYGGEVIYAPYAIHPTRRK